MFIFGWITHLFLSLALSLKLISLFGFDIESNTIILLGVMIGSLLPDCDLRDSKLSGILPLWLISEGHAIKKGIKDVELIRYHGHRKLTHSLVWVLFLIVLYYTIYLGVSKIFSFNILNNIKYFFIGNIIGNILHIFEDYFNKSGVRLFYKIPKIDKNYHFFKTIRTGGFTEDIMGLTCFVYCIIYIFKV